MTKSNKKKAKIRRLKSFRLYKKSFNCKDCGKLITDTIHHFFCNKCWKKRQAKKNRYKKNE